MKKFYAILVVLSLVVISSVAMAEVTVSGSVDIRSLLWNNVVDQNSDVSSSKDKTTVTMERIRLNIDAKNDNVKARVTFENDWDAWGRFESPQANATTTVTNVCLDATGTPVLCTGPGGNTPGPGQKAAPTTSDAGRLKIREGWIDFQIPGAGPAHVKVGHQFLQLGNGWFFRSMKYGSDAWVVGMPGKNTLAFVDAKFQENNVNNADDVDAYVVLDNFQLSDTSTVGAYFARVADKQAKFFLGAAAANGDEANLDNIGIWYNGKVGPINLQAELDYQMGEVKTAGGKSKFKGNQIVLQANLPIDPLSINATIARGTGDDPASNDTKNIVTALDADPHYTFIYEYFAKTACGGGLHTGFCNTQALNIGAGFSLSKNISLNLDYWMLTANEKVSINGAAASDDVGTELDLVMKFKLYDQLTWNWQIGRLMPGKAYDYAGKSADNVDAIQGILSYKF